MTCQCVTEFLIAQFLFTDLIIIASNKKTVFTPIAFSEMPVVI